MEISVPLETENFWRASMLILDEVPKTLRLYFLQEWYKKYPNLKWDDTQASGKIFWQGIIIFATLFLISANIY